MKQIEERIDNIQKGNLQGLSQSLWYMDTQYAKTQLEGILQYPDIQYLEVTSIVQQNNFSAGTNQTENIRSYKFDLWHKANGKDYEVGKIHILVDLNNMYKRILRDFVAILCGQALTVFMVSGFVFVIVQWLITRHLVSISNHVKALDAGSNLGQSLQLPKSVKHGNELSQVATAINTMEKNLHQKVASLKESEARYLDLYDSAPDMYVSVDAQTTFIMGCNQTLCNMTGYTKAEIIGQPIFSMYHADCMDDVKSAFQEFTTTGSVHNAELQLKAKDGSTIEVMLNASAVRDSQGKILYSRSSWRDITEKKKIEKERKALEIRLRQQQKMESIGQLAGGIAHDFNNMLSPILGFTEIVMDELPKDHPSQDSLNEIYESAKRASSLVKRILLFSRQKEHVLKPVQLGPVIDESLKLLRSTIPANIDIKQGNLDNENYVLCDTTEIHEIILNLCTNAYHSFDEQTGTITINLSSRTPPPEGKLPEGQYLCLSVSDNGIGIAPENIDKIFEPFFTTKEVGKGTGLGLSVVHGIVKNYKGDIYIESSPGKGTTFNIFFPVTTQAVIDDLPQEKNTILEGDKKILFVDDEQSIVRYGVRALGSKGYDVTGVHDPLEALSLFRSNPSYYDLVISDMAMPGMVGSQLAKKILETRPDMPIIICSGFSEALDTQEIEKLNIQAIIDKPIPIKELIGKITEFFADPKK